MLGNSCWDPPLLPANKTQICSPSSSGPLQSRRPHHHKKKLEPNPQRPDCDPPHPAEPQPTLTSQRPGTLRRGDRVRGVEASEELGLGGHGPEGAARGAMGIVRSGHLAGGLRGRVAPMVGVVGGLQAAPALAGVFGFALAAPHGPGLQETDTQTWGFIIIIIITIIKLPPRACMTDTCL